MENKNKVPQLHENPKQLSHTESQTKCNHKAYLSSSFSISFSHPPSQQRVLQNSTLMPSFQELPFDGSRWASL